MRPYNSEKRRQEYLRNRDKYLEQNRIWRENNRDHKNKISREYYYKDKDENVEKYLLKYAKLRAKQKNLPFDLELEDIVIPDKCPIMDVKFDRGNKKYSPSIDRIEPELGYIKSNIQIICTLANQMKWNSTKEELIQFCKGVLSKEVE
jgi:hypothetical protein